MSTRAIPATKVRDNFAEVIGRVAYARERLILKRHGKPLVALIPVQDLRVLEELEERHNPEREKAK